ncbi:MAG: MFS transporter [Oscillospiraceae bacterium]|nr:MFS transporter [Oscillospiraceae bacterium]
MRIIRSKWKLFFYGMGAMGVNMLNLIVGSYLCDALMTEGFATEVEYWTYSNTTLVVAGIWSVLIMLSKILDGLIDIPLASFADNLKSKWGRRRPALVLGLIPMILAYIGFLNPIAGPVKSLVNTIWCGVMLCIFYSFYTLTMGTYYATFSEIVDNDGDRLSLSNFKTVFDIVYYVMGYALIPLMISARINIRIVGYIFLPLVLLMLIPISLIKEPSSLDKDRNDAQKKEIHVGMVQSFKYCIANKSFVIWMVIYCFLQFGLQIYITGQNVYYSGIMNLQGFQMTILMACVYAPVPFTLILYNRIVRKRGLRTGYLFSLSAFIVAMVFMLICRADILKDVTLRLVVAAIGSVISSFGIGCFFSINYTVPSSLADAEYRQTGITHPTMFFAVQGLSSAIATAIATGPVWVNLKGAGLTWLLPVVAIAGTAVSFGLTFLLPKELGMIGKTPDKDQAG